MDSCNHLRYHKILSQYLYDQQGNARRRLFYSSSQSCDDIYKLLRILSPIQVKRKTQINMRLGNMVELHILNGMHLYHSMIDQKNIFESTNMMGCHYYEWNVVSNANFSQGW